MHKLLVMGARSGHSTTPFAPPTDNTRKAQKSRKEAEKVFNSIMLRPGWTVIANVAPPELEGQTMTEFDARVEELVAIPPRVGG